MVRRMPSLRENRSRRSFSSPARYGERARSEGIPGKAARLGYRTHRCPISSHTHDPSQKPSRHPLVG